MITLLLKGTGFSAALTAWRCHRVVGEEVGSFVFFFVLARRIDVTHALRALAIQERERGK